MRVRSLSATALAAAAVFLPLGAGAQAADTDLSIREADAADSSDGTSTAMTTYTLTRTVMRVVQTTTATRPANMTLSTTFVPTLASAGRTLTPYVNGTASVLGTSATPTSSSQTLVTPSGAASRIGMDTVGWAAIAGVAGLLAF